MATQCCTTHCLSRAAEVRCFEETLQCVHVVDDSPKQTMASTSEERVVWFASPFRVSRSDRSAFVCVRWARCRCVSNDRSVFVRVRWARRRCTSMVCWTTVGCPTDDFATVVRTIEEVSISCSRRCSAKKKYKNDGIASASTELYDVRTLSHLSCHFASARVCTVHRVYWRQ